MMDPRLYVRACLRVRIRRAAKMVVSLVVAIIITAVCMTAIAIPAASAAPHKKSAADAASARRIAALRRSDASLSSQMTVIQNELYVTAVAWRQIADQRDLALGRLQQQLVTRYRTGDVNPITEMIGGRGLGAALDQARLAKTIEQYQSRLVSDLDAAEQSAATAYDRADLLTGRALVLQKKQIKVRAEIARLITAQEQRDYDADERKRRRQAAARQSTALVGGASGLVGMGLPSGTVLPVMTGPASAQGIDMYLASKGSPMAGNGVFFMLSGQRWGIDPRLLVAISGAESNFGQNTCGPHNAWGWACPNDPEDFATWADGIETISSGLRRYYLDDGLGTVAMIQTKYAPSKAANDPTGLNNNWAGNVTKFLLELGGNPNQLAGAGYTSPPLSLVPAGQSGAQGEL